jgi:predicted small lipoprotein YifL
MVSFLWLDESAYYATFQRQPQPLSPWARYTLAMKITRTLIILLLCTACVACGNKGPLVRPDTSTDAPAQVPSEKQSSSPSPSDEQ